MRALLRSINYKKITLNHKTTGEYVDVQLRSGETISRSWLGFIDVTEAKELPDARPVKLLVDRYNDGNGWVDLQPSERIQGCLVADGVYAVLSSQIRVIAGFSVCVAPTK